MPIKNHSAGADSFCHWTIENHESGSLYHRNATTLAYNPGNRSVSLF